MEPIITIVGFLGAGKTTVLKSLVDQSLKQEISPFIILNDYENASIDAQYFLDKLSSQSVKPLNGSCICCSGLDKLRDFVNNIPVRENGITFIEANGTSDACSLAGFLGVGISEQFLPPIQISVVDVNNWQKRGLDNELEANQIQVSSLIVLTHTDKVSRARLEQVKKEISIVNTAATLIPLDSLDVSLIASLLPVSKDYNKIEHKKTHWSSCSVDLPVLSNLKTVKDLCDKIPKSILRVKGCTQLKGDDYYTYFERVPDGEVYVRRYNGVPITGPKLISIGVGSNSEVLENAIEYSLTTIN